MIFKSSYIVTENNGILRCEPVIGRRQIFGMSLAAIASVAAGIVAFNMLSANLPAPNRVSWSLSPPTSSRVAAHVAPRGPIVMTTARMVPSKVESADKDKAQPRI